LRLICLDRYPGVTPFHGLGQLRMEQLAELLPQRSTVTQAQLDLAAAAWEALCSPDPRSVEDLARQDTAALPFLGAALRRWLEQFPAVDNGLDRLERDVLQALDPDQHTSVLAVFGSVSAAEPPAFFGDTFLWGVVNDMAACPTPLLELDGGRPLPVWGDEPVRDRSARLTRAGADVLAGRADAVRLNGIERWIGGVHLSGTDTSPWRWDRARRRLVACASPERECDEQPKRPARTDEDEES
jgi:hypothetical protein